jgi:hypothetical protein
MVDYSLPLFQNPREVWDTKKCEKMAKRIARDGLGTPYSFRGYIGHGHGSVPMYGKVYYNGGTVKNGKWFQGEDRPLPKVAKGFKIVYRPTWGFQIVKVQHHKKSGGKQ